jgi:phospholipid transport system substrate-binding protein
MKKIIFISLVLSLTLAWSQTDPVETLKANNAKLQSLLKLQKKESTPERKEEIKVLINSIFDFKEMGRKALPKKVWKENVELQERFTSAFKGMVENASVKKIEAYESDSTKFEPAKIKKKKAKVKATVWAGSNESETTYKFHLVDGEWKAWDLIIDELSTKQNYAEQFKILLKKKTFLELVEFLESKAK